MKAKPTITYHAIFRFCERVMHLKPPFNTWEIYLAKLLIQEEIDMIDFPPEFNKYEIRMKAHKNKFVVRNGKIITIKHITKQTRRSR